MSQLTREQVASDAKDGDFSGKDLSGLDLSGLKFKDTEFEGANLAGVRFSGSKLKDCNFDGANLQQADLSQTKVKECSFEKSNLAGARFDAAAIDGCDFDGANLEGISHQGVSWLTCNMQNTALYQEVMNQHMGAVQDQIAGGNAAAISADPSLLEPVGGIALDRYAAIVVGMTQLAPTASQDDVNVMLAQHGIDRATWDSVNAGWIAKMQNDTSSALATKYGEVFVAAQRQASGTGDAEPCSFERYCEILAAQRAWSEQGLDAGGQFKQVFGIGPGDWASIGGYWHERVTRDAALAGQMGGLMERYMPKYEGAKIADLDADLIF